MLGWIHAITNRVTRTLATIDCAAFSIQNTESAARFQNRQREPGGASGHGTGGGLHAAAAGQQPQLAAVDECHFDAELQHDDG